MKNNMQATSTMGDRYYIAYGSNLNVVEMQYRAPGSTFVGVGTLKGYRLCFKYYATLEKDKKSKVKVGVFLIHASDEKNLDKYEGYPQLYRKEKVEVKLGKKTIKALVYIMNDGYCDYCLPDKDYVNRCLDGYYSCQIPAKQFKKAVLYTMERF